MPACTLLACEGLNWWRGAVAILFQWVSGRVRRRKLAQQLRTARRAGHGLFVHEWRLSPEAVPEQLLGWCRETLAGCRRPWGIAHFDLTIAISAADLANPQTLRLSRLEPTELWSADALLARIATLLPARPESAAPVHVAASLFSWGEAAHAAGNR
jgi:hypothetical protein